MSHNRRSNIHQAKVHRTLFKQCELAAHILLNSTPSLKESSFLFTNTQLSIVKIRIYFQQGIFIFLMKLVSLSLIQPMSLTLLNT